VPTVDQSFEHAVAPEVALPAPRPRRRRPPLFVVLAGAFTILVLVLAVIGPIIANGAARDVSVNSALLSPSSSHPLGTDALGRDVLARLVVGARTCVLGALLITVLTAVLSTVIGLFAGYFGGWFDAVVSRLVDVVYSLPNLLVAIVVVGVLGGGYALAIAVLVVLAVPYNVRYIRAATLEQRGLPYIEAARGLGLSRTTIARRHILPNLSTVIISTVALRFTFAVVDLATISFLGLGVPPGTPDWGAMLSDSRATVFVTPWPMIAPLVMIALTVISANVLGDWLHGKSIERGRGE
jgi:ABC-type dipeptide/oligopeptide/nickel transport system permease subunit